MPSTATTGRKTVAARVASDTKETARIKGTSRTKDVATTKGTEPHEHVVPEGGVVHVHTLDVHGPVHIPYVTPGDVLATTQEVTSRMSTKDFLFYGGLGALALAGALEWPVALAVGGATVVVRGWRKTEPVAPQNGAKEEEEEEAAGAKT